MTNVPNLMTMDADNAALRYGTLVDGWRSLYIHALDQSHFGTGKQHADVMAQAYGVARNYLARETPIIEDDASQYAREAQRVTLDSLSSKDAQELAGPASEHLSASNAYLYHQIQTQIERDIAFLGHTLRMTYLHVTMAARANGQPLRAALMQYRIGNASELQFVALDRRSHKWPSRNLVRAMYRQHLVAIYNEVVLMTLADHGVNSALITHTDAKSPHHGTLISMDSNSSLPTYAELKGVVFHPNSEAILGAP